MPTFEEFKQANLNDVCPFCKSENIQYLEILMEDNETMIERGTCNDCEKYWNREFKISNFYEETD